MSKVCKLSNLSQVNSIKAQRMNTIGFLPTKTINALLSFYILGLDHVVQQR